MAEVCSSCLCLCQVGYFADPPSVPGLAHWLEHSVHLGSNRYPGDNEYKTFLAQHGGSSNAATSAGGSGEAEGGGGGSSDIVMCGLPLQHFMLTMTLPAVAAFLLLLLLLGHGAHIFEDCCTY